MEKEEIRLHLNQILGNIASVQTAIKDHSMDDFMTNEQMKEMVYSYLQEIGQAAHELSAGTKEALDDQLPLEQLAVLRNARYNQEAEIHDQNTWAIITTDLPEVGEQIEQSELYSVM